MQIEDDNKIASGEYAEKGDYHKSLDKNWPYYPVYLAKKKYVEKFLARVSKQAKILDAGCGEGVLVEEFKKQGYDISGLDINYQSAYVTKGDLTATDFKAGTFDLVMCLDVIEHLSFAKQEAAFKEIQRILKSNGIMLAAIPNLAHLTSRISFFLRGKLVRTSSIERHIGDRPIGEYIKLIKKYFTIENRKGIFPTYLIPAILTYKVPSKVVWLHKILNKFLAYPNWCFLNIFTCRKK